MLTHELLDLKMKIQLKFIVQDLNNQM
jgi:hypothetical protein